MRTPRLPVLHDALRMRTRTRLDEMPSLGLADANGLAIDALGVAVAALPVGRERGVAVVVGEDDGGEEDGEEGGELHDDGDGGGVVVDVIVDVMCWCCSNWLKLEGLECGGGERG